MKILMVCLGNICRSPLAEGILKDKCIAKGLNWKIESAGTAGYHVGCAPHHQSQKIALLNGVDISNQQCRKFVKDDMDRYDLIYVMDQSNYENVKLIAEEKWNLKKVKLILSEVNSHQNNEVPDPWNGTDADFMHVYNLLDTACNHIITNYCAIE